MNTQNIVFKISLDELSPNDAADPYEERIGDTVIAESFWTESRYSQAIGDTLSIVAVLEYELRLDAPEEESIQGELIPELCFWYFGDNISVSYPEAIGLETFGLKSSEGVVVEYQGRRLPYLDPKNK